MPLLLVLVGWSVLITTYKTFRQLHMYIYIYIYIYIGFIYLLRFRGKVKTTRSGFISTQPIIRTFQIFKTKKWENASFDECIFAKKRKKERKKCSPKVLSSWKLNRQVTITPQSNWRYIQKFTFCIATSTYVTLRITQSLVRYNGMNVWKGSLEYECSKIIEWGARD